MHIRSNAFNIDAALEHLRGVVEARVKAAPDQRDSEIEFPQLSMYDDDSPFGNFVKERQPSFEEYVVLLLSLVHHVRPDFLESVIRNALPESGSFPELGGVRDRENRAFVPTGQTALYLLAGNDLSRRFEIQQILNGDHWFSRDGILQLEPAREGEPFWSGRLLMNPEYIERFTLGSVSSPVFGAEFPAREIHTELEWEDLILGPQVLDQIQNLRHWVDHHETLLHDWNMRRLLKPGYRVLFHGPPGTGKTLTATLLGKYTKRRVFRIDLSAVISKYIGETEKNLSRLFDKAANRRWIIFFDEGEVLFSKRTNIAQAHDKFANQEVSYLLQRVEEFDGLVILATNFKANIDEAFLRRFNAVIGFPFPSEKERTLMWQKALPDQLRCEPGINLPELLGKFELAGGSIVNVLQYICIEAMARGNNVLTLADALRGIRLEMEKEGRVFKNVLSNESE